MQQQHTHTHTHTHTHHNTRLSLHLQSVEPGAKPHSGGLRFRPVLVKVINNLGVINPHSTTVVTAEVEGVVPSVLNADEPGDTESELDEAVNVPGHVELLPVVVTGGPVDLRHIDHLDGVLCVEGEGGALLIGPIEELCVQPLLQVGGTLQKVLTFRRLVSAALEPVRLETRRGACRLAAVTAIPAPVHVVLLVAPPVADPTRERYLVAPRVLPPRPLLDVGRTRGVDQHTVMLSGDNVELLIAPPLVPLELQTVVP